MNNVSLTGRICRDVKVERNGAVPCTRNAVACTRDYKEKDGTYKCDFIQFVAWGQCADYIGVRGHKGDSIEIIGAWRAEETKRSDGSTITYNYLFVKDCHIIPAQKPKKEEKKEEVKKEEPVDLDDLPF